MRSRVTRLFGTRRACDVISKRSETDRYRYPLCSLLFRGGRELFLRGYRFSGILIERGAEREGYFGHGLRLLATASGFILQWCALLYRLTEP